MCPQLLRGSTRCQWNKPATHLVSHLVDDCQSMQCVDTLSRSGDDGNLIPFSREAWKTLEIYGQYQTVTGQQNRSVAAGVWLEILTLF